MTKSLMILLGCLVLALSGAGCLSTGYRGESFPATASVEVLPRAEKPPAGYEFIGRGWVSGEASATTRSELEARMLELAQAHGADAVVIMGVVLRPAGEMVNDESNDAIVASSDPDQAHTLVAFNQDVGDYGAINRSTRFVRKMYADFLRKGPIVQP